MDHYLEATISLKFQRQKFQKHINILDYTIDQSIEFSQSTTYWVGELDNN